MKDLKRFISNNNNNEEKEQEVELQSERFRSIYHSGYLMLKSIKLKILEQKANVVSTTVNFSTKHRAMLGNVRKWIDKGHVALDPDLFPELLTELRIATADEEMSLDKRVFDGLA